MDAPHLSARRGNNVNVDPFVASDIDERLTKHLQQYFDIAHSSLEHEAATLLDRKIDQLNGQQLRDYYLIMIGAKHGEQVEQISKLVHLIALQYPGPNRLALLVEEEAIGALYLDEIPQEIKDNIKVLCWDTSEKKTFLTKFYKVIDPLLVSVSNRLMQYLNDFSINNLRLITEALFAWYKNLVEKQEIQEIFASASSFEKLELLEEGLKEQLTKLAEKEIPKHEQEILMLSWIEDFLSTLSKIAMEITLQSQKARNETLVENAKKTLSTYERVILIAGEHHLILPASLQLKANENIQAGLETLLPLKDLYEGYFPIILETLASEEVLPIPIPLPRDWHQIDQTPPRNKASEENPADPEAEPAGYEEEHTQRIEPITILNSQQNMLKKEIKIIKTTAINTIYQQFAKIFQPIMEVISRRGRIVTTPEYILLYELILTTLKRVIDLIKNRPPPPSKMQIYMALVRKHFPDFI